MDRVFNRLETKFVGRSVNVTAARAAARQPHREAVMVTVVPIDFPGISPGRGQFSPCRVLSEFPPQITRVPATCRAL